MNEGSFNFINSTLRNNYAIKSSLVSLDDTSDSLSSF